MVIFVGVVEDRVEVDVIDLGDRADISGDPLGDLEGVLALQREQVADLEGLAPVPDEQLAVLGDGALVDAEHAEAPHERVDGDLEDVSEGVPGRIGGQRDALRGGTFPFQEHRRVAFHRVRQEPREDLQELVQARPRAGRDEAHRDQMSFAQGLLERLV